MAKLNPSVFDSSFKYGKITPSTVSFHQNDFLKSNHVWFFSTFHGFLNGTGDANVSRTLDQIRRNSAFRDCRALLFGIIATL